MGGAHERDRGLISQRVHLALHDLERDRIHPRRRQAHSASSTRLPCPSTEAEKPGGTTQVASYSSTIAGPVTVVRSSSRRATIGVETASPYSGPKYAPR